MTSKLNHLTHKPTQSDPRQPPQPTQIIMTRFAIAAARPLFFARGLGTAQINPSGVVAPAHAIVREQALFAKKPKSEGAEKSSFGGVRPEQAQAEGKPQK